MRILNKKAVSIIEYSVLFVIVIGAFLVMQKYIQRGFYGKWAHAGQGMAFGRQYDPQNTIDCGYDGTSNQWYDRNCYQYYVNLPGSQCNGSIACEEGIITGVCSSGGGNSACEQLNNGAST